MHSVKVFTPRTFTLLLILINISVLNACGKEPGTRIHYDNPFAESQKWYVNPKWAEQARASGGEAIANESTAIWLTRVSDIKPHDGWVPRNGMGLREHLDAALEQQADLFTFVMYNIPGKGCPFAGSSLTPSDKAHWLKGIPLAEDMVSYKRDFISGIMEILKEEKYAGISIVAIVEPDTLIHQTHNHLGLECKEASNQYDWGYTESVRYALTQLSTLKNVHSYIGAGNASILGWQGELSLAALYIKGVLTGFEGLNNKVLQMKDVLEMSPKGEAGYYRDVSEAFVESVGETPPPGWGAINGFITNISHYVPLEEPYLVASPEPTTDSLQGASFYHNNPIFGELEYSKKWLATMREHGADESLGMLIDTSRNGWGGPNRPKPQVDIAFASIEEQVNTMRIDRRGHRRSLCNQEGAGIGERPKVSPKDYIDAYIWAKPVGESDGKGGGTRGNGFSSDPVENEKFKNASEICDPRGANAYAEEVEITKWKGIGTGAMEDAPHFGEWFPYAFKQLLENAYPPIENDPIGQSSK